MNELAKAPSDAARRGGLAGLFAGLTTRGRCLVAGGLATAVCAIGLDERDLLRIGAFAALLPVLALLLTARTRRTVRVGRALTPERLPVGSEATVALHLSGGPIVGALRLIDAVPDAAGSQSATPPRFTVHRLSRRSGAMLTYPLRPILRGVHRIGPLGMHATDPFGLAAFERDLAGSQRLLVLPRVVALHGLPQALSTGDGAGATAAHQGHGQSDVLIREYRPGDELRRVHWRSSARHDELMVRLEERPWRGTITVLLDRRDSAHRGRGPGSSLEFAVELVASICVHLIARGEPVALVTEDGTDPTRPVHGDDDTPVDTMRSRVDLILETLAILRPSARIDLAGPALGTGGSTLAVLGAVAPGQLEGLLARRANGSRDSGQAVLLDAASWDPATRSGAVPVRSTAASLRQAGWRVAIATADSTPDRVWSELIASASPYALGVGST
ncbi:MAG: DUF58 domain-containing protein [Pseudonocardia sp.]